MKTRLCLLFTSSMSKRGLEKSKSLYLHACTHAYPFASLALVTRVQQLTARPVASAVVAAQAILGLVDHVTWGKRRGATYQAVAGDFLLRC
eukprot:m.287253 g.287253  ORF g.287253 m.287253 type:complete len:91 (-) comp17786_c0_seq7:3394-3666(-)